VHFERLLSFALLFVLALPLRIRNIFCSTTSAGFGSSKKFAQSLAAAL